MKKLTYLLVALFLIVLEAVPEGLALGGHKMIAGIIEAVKLVGIAVVIYAFFAGFSYTHANMHTVVEYLFLLAGYFLLRFGIFDIIFNISAGQELFFRGTTKLYDIIMGRLGTWGWFIQGCCVLPGIVFLMEWRHGIVKKFEINTSYSSLLRN